MTDHASTPAGLLHPSDEQVVCPRCLAGFRWSDARLSVAVPRDTGGPQDTDSRVTYRRLVDEAELMAGSTGAMAAYAQVMALGAMRVCPASIPDDHDPAAPYPVPSNFYTRLGAAEPFHEMPYDYGDHDRLVIAVVGSGKSGKSTYLAALYWSLAHDDVSRLGFASRCWAYPPMWEYERAEARPLNVERQPIPGTDHNTGRTITLTLERNDDGAPGPDQGPAAAIDSVFRRRSRPGSPRMAHVVLFDIAGETLLDPTAAASSYPLLAADGFLFMVEPDSLPEVARRRGRPSTTDGTVRDADMFIGYLRRVDEMRQAGEAEPWDGYRPLSERPVAVVVSKADELDPLASSAPPQWLADLPRALGEDRVAGRWDVGTRLAAGLPFAGDEATLDAALEQRSETVFGFMHAHGATRLTTQLMRTFDQTSFHFVSATGFPLSAPAPAREDDGGRGPDGPEGGRADVEPARYPAIRPRGVLAPILTLLYQARRRGGPS